MKVRAKSLVAALVIALIGIGGITGCGGASPEGFDPTTRPQYVVQAYLDRLQDGDRQKASELLTDTGRRNGGSPIVHGRMIDLELTAPRPAPKRHNGRPVVDAVTVTISFTRVNETSPNLNNGPARWTFIVVQEREGAPWLIGDQGLG